MSYLLYFVCVQFIQNANIKTKLQLHLIRGQKESGKNQMEMD
jgi:hypothetical protein